MKPDSRKGRREQIAPPQAPEDWSFVARHDPGDEKRRRGRMLACGAGLHNLVNRTECETDIRQLFVDGTQMKRQHRPSSATVLKPPNALA
jgi:hypothetical protein